MRFSRDPRDHLATAIILYQPRRIARLVSLVASEARLLDDASFMLRSHTGLRALYTASLQAPFVHCAA